MNNFLEKLKHYLATTPKDEILAAWKKTAKYDKIGPKMSELFHFEKQKSYIVLTQTEYEFCTIKFNESNPKYSSGFLMPIVW